MTTAAPDPIRAILTAYAAAVYAKDVTALLALYADDVHIFDTWDHWSRQGIGAWRESVTDWLTTLAPQERVVVDAEDFASHTTPAMAYATAVLRFTAVGPDNAPIRSLQNRLTIVLEPRAGAWKIVHEHTSSPIDSGSMKAHLKR